MSMDFDMDVDAMSKAIFSDGQGFSDDMETNSNGYAIEDKPVKEKNTKSNPQELTDESLFEYSGNSVEYGEWEYDQFDPDDEGKFISDETGEEYSSSISEEPEETMSYPDLASLDDDFEINLFIDEYGQSAKAKKADLIEAYKTKERFENMNAIIMGAGADLAAYEKNVIERSEGMTYQCERIISECKQKLSNPHLTSNERAKLYDTIEAEQTKLGMIQHHVSNTRREREAAEAKVNQTKIATTSHVMTNNYRWDNDTLVNVDRYLAGNLRGYNASMLSPELLIMARKAMEHDNAKSSKTKESFTKIKTSGKSINAAERAASKARADEKAKAARAAKEGKLSPQDMFKWLED